MNDTVVSNEEPGEEVGSEPVQKINPISNAVNRFVHKVLDIEECAKSCIPQAIQVYKKRARSINTAFKKNQAILEGKESREEKLVAARELRQALRRAKRFELDTSVFTLERSLFIGLFSCFDKFVGELMFAVYQVSPDLYKGLNCQLTVSEILGYPSLDELREAVLDKEIETVRRKSYSEQFKEFERRFSFETLTKFENWPRFIESAQRRNLFTHCDGVISQQYLKACVEVGYKVPDDAVVGHQLKINSEYFFKTCLVVAEVGVMLGQTIWRKMLPDEIKEADSALNTLIYDYLQNGDFEKVISLCKFANGLPKISNEVMARMFTINYAIAVKNVSGLAAAKKILDKKDWSATIYDFKLARAVLLDDFDSAKEHMLKIGQSSDLVFEDAYHDWPLFKQFRESEQFLEGYEQVFGVKYLAKLSELVASTQAAAAEDAQEG
ncbi:hypothetical protein Q1W70_01855 [Pseudomonas kielensis]|uniref:hypothetical protein n=1 Tax=Pseudomonas kielensis TaxID=2762577 RepID=UPI00265D85B7|nr:hypothetical protein [Pseudomonas kielensis]WKL53359.1 hypothetical protein Q1W70_01855 [Pseudomonas kielensis]